MSFPHQQVLAGALSLSGITGCPPIMSRHRQRVPGGKICDVHIHDRPRLPVQREQQPHRQKQRRSATSCLLDPHSPNLTIVSGREGNVHDAWQLIVGGEIQDVSALNFYINYSSLAGSYHSPKYFDEWSL